MNGSTLGEDSQNQLERGRNMLRSILKSDRVETLPPV